MTAVCSEIHTEHVNALCGQNVEFVGEIAKLRKAAVGFVMSAHPSVLMEQHGSHWTDFHET